MVFSAVFPSPSSWLNAVHLTLFPLLSSSVPSNSTSTVALVTHPPSEPGSTVCRWFVARVLLATDHSSLAGGLEGPLSHSRVRVSPERPSVGPWRVTTEGGTVRERNTCFFN